MSSIGIITRTKNRPTLLRRALQSVVKQSFANWKLVVVNDGGAAGPVDQLIAELPQSCREKIQVVHHTESKGMEAASNVGLARLQTDYVLIHDDDDSLHPEFCQQTVGYLDNPPHPRVRGVVTGTERVIERVRGDTVRELKRFRYNRELRTVELRRMLAGNVFAPIAFVFSREACEELGGFREDLPVLGDWEYNVRFLQRYEIGVIPEVLAYYHDRDQRSDEGYASSMTSKARLHEFYGSFLRNEWLREDLSNKRPGIGLIASVSPQLISIHEKLRNPLRLLFKW